MRAPNKTKEEFAEVFSRVELMARPEMYRLMLLLTVRLGLRPVEIAGLDTSWFSGGELRIPHGYSKGKGGHGNLPVNDEVLAALDCHMQGRKGRVFLNQRNQPFDAAGISNALRRLYREAGQQGSAYCGRRTLATNLADRGVNLVVISKVLRHRNVATTAEYIGCTEKMLRNALYA